MIAAALMTLALAWPANSTAYCLTSQTASGTYSVPGTVAMNNLAFGTKITARGPYGRTRWVVRDRPDQFTQLDFWIPSCDYALNVWGRKTVNVRIGWRQKRGKVIKKATRKRLPPAISIWDYRYVIPKE